MKNLLLLGLVLFCYSAHAQGDHMGGHDGGGGKGLICYDDKGNITSAELLDFFEGRTLESYEIPELPGDYKSIFQEVIKKSASHSILTLMKSASRFEEGFKFLPKGVRLNPINDSSEIFIPTNCKFEQLANFQGISRIFIVKDFWDKLSETSKAGLLMHEFLWYVDREAGAKKSSRARRTVARFFATNYTFAPINLDVKAGDLDCMTTNPNRPDVKFKLGNEFFVSQITGTNSCLLRFNYLNGVPVFSRQTAVLEDCSGWQFEKVWYSPQDDMTRILTGKTDDVEITSYPEGQMSHELTISLKVTQDESTLKPLKRTFQMQVSNKEFPGFDEGEVEIDCGHKLDEDDLKEHWWDQ